MASDPRQLIAEYTNDALRDLESIWEWNARQYGVDHADAYVLWLREVVLGLTRLSDPGSPVPDRPTFRYAIIKRKRGRLAHIAVFKVDGDALRILRFFHNAQNWTAKVEEDELAD